MGAETVGGLGAVAGGGGIASWLMLGGPAWLAAGLIVASPILGEAAPRRMRPVGAALLAAGAAAVATAVLLARPWHPESEVAAWCTAHQNAWVAELDRAAQPYWGLLPFGWQCGWDQLPGNAGEGGPFTGTAAEPLLFWGIALIVLGAASMLMRRPPETYAASDIPAPIA